jgi:hypothetical protein
LYRTDNGRLGGLLDAVIPSDTERSEGEARDLAVAVVVFAGESQRPRPDSSAASDGFGMTSRVRAAPAVPFSVDGVLRAA